MAQKTVTNIAKGTVPYDDAHEANGLIFDALTLLHAALDVDSSKETDCRHGLTDNASRRDNLLMQAQDKCAAAIEKLAI